MKNTREQHGFSLVTVLSVTLLASLWLAAASTNLLLVYRAANASRYAGELSIYADSTADYVVQNLDSQTGRATFDRKSNVLVIGSVWGGPASVKSYVTTSDVAPVSSNLLGTNGQQSNTVSSNWSIYPIGGASPWKKVLIQTQYAGFTKNIELILAFQPSPPTAPGTNTLFASALLTSGPMSLGNQFQTSSYDSISGQTFIASDGVHALGGDVTSYSPISLSGDQINIGGSLTAMSISSKGAGTTSAVTAATALPTGTTVSRYVNTSGVVSGFNDAAGTFGSGPANVLGLTNGTTFLSSQSLPIQTAQDAIAAQANNPIAPTPIVSSTTPALSTASINAPISIPGGSYTSTGINVSASGSIEVVGSQPLSLYVSNSASSSGTVVSLTGAVNQNGVPGNFQLFYDGTGTIDLRGANLKGAIYAPNASVLMSNTNVVGAIVAKQVSGGTDINGNILSAQNVNIVFDRAFTNPQELKNNGLGGLLYNPSAMNSQLNSTASIYKVVCYLEGGKLH